MDNATQTVTVSLPGRINDSMSHPGQRRVADERGFTIVEVLIAAVIITLALVALATIVPIGVYGVQEGNQTSAATFLADQKLEQAKSLPWASVPANDCSGCPPPRPSPRPSPRARRARSERRPSPEAER